MKLRSKLLTALLAGLLAFGAAACAEGDGLDGGDPLQEDGTLDDGGLEDGGAGDTDTDL